MLKPKSFILNFDNTVEKVMNQDFECGVFELHPLCCLLGQKKLTLFYFHYYAKTKRAFRKALTCFELAKKTLLAWIDTKRSSSTAMALRVFGALLVLSFALEFSRLCEGQYQCLVTSCRQKEVRQLGLTKYMILQASISGKLIGKKPLQLKVVVCG